MAGKSTAFANELLKLIFNGTSMVGLAVSYGLKA